MIKEHIPSLSKASSELERLISTPFSVECNDLLSNEQTAYADFLEIFIIESGLTTAEPYPTIEHKRIVQRTLQRKKPFKLLEKFIEEGAQSRTTLYYAHPYILSRVTKAHFHLAQYHALC